jgi:hypothetical protein
MITKREPGIYHSDMTRRFYFVSSFGKSGLPKNRTDVTDNVMNVVSHARGPLEDAIADALAIYDKAVQDGCASVQLKLMADRLTEALQDDWLAPHAAATVGDG